ncbi:MAG: Hsp70 family protein [Vicinamibacteria bacterium]|nr:Hsp70 family protein [Vicinamibacteria bacterium]
MARATIDYGIDLGTTNSSIAVLEGTEPHVFKNNEGFEYTPSAVFQDKTGALRVGRRAYERLVIDPENAFSEFKLQMGTGREYTFKRSGHALRPEDLSAEVLKELKRDVAQRSGENVEAAVITVPAAFELPQCEATKQAAQRAGFVASPLLQEPVAAALAYGFQSESDKVFWLVYDFGGGTFDAAVIHVRDGVIQVVNHGGDNHLGGKLIDWSIVEQLLIPAVHKQHPVSDLSRANLKHAGAIAKLKQNAELAKIRLSREGSVEIAIDGLCQDDRGESVLFEYELRRSDVEPLIEPYVERAINICRKVLSERRLGAGDVEKVLLVGGPTLTPYLRQRLAEGLGIPLEFSIDPLTVVARGAAIFSGTQRLESTSVAAPVAGQCQIQLEYKPVGADTEPLVGGRVTSPDGADVSDYTVEFVNAEARPPWRSGRTAIAANGGFMTSLWAEKGRPNTFRIELCDQTGRLLPVSPDQLVYTVGLSITDPPLIHSVGVALANNEMEWLLDKGTPLPARRLKVLRTAIDVRRGNAHHSIKIPVMEGQNPRADRNQLIGNLEITSDQVQRDVPAGSEVEVTIEIDASRLLKATAYLPILDNEFGKVISYDEYRKQARHPDELRNDVERQKKRLEEARDKGRQTGDPRAGEALARIEREHAVSEVEGSLAAGAGDPDAADKCEKRLLDLKSAIDEVEDALEWPALVASAEKEVEVERKIVNDPDFKATAEEKQAFAALEQDVRRAVKERDPDLLRGRVQEMDRLGAVIVLRQPGFWVGRLGFLETKKHLMTDPARADEYIAQARRAINNNDVEALKAAVRQLAGLLPAGDEDRDKVLSGLIR